MRIENIDVQAFGRLTGLDTGTEPLGSLVVVLGPNEAGKSTLFSFLTTALYGFLPATRERNPHVPWGSDEASGSVRISLQQGGSALVERRLRSSPSARVTVGDDATILRNQPLPWVDHVPRTVFRQVFAITLADLAGLDEETWARIQDRVLGSMGTTDVRPAREVADELEREAGEIWRPNRRGNQLLREVQGQIRDLRSRRARALERDREIRDLVEARENVRMRLRETREDRQRERASVERSQELLPLKRQLDRIDALRAEGGPRADLARMPDDPAGRLRELDEESRRLRAALEAAAREVVAPTEAIEAFDADARRLLEHRDRISRFRVRAASVERDRVRVVELSSAVDELGIRLGTAADHLLTAEWDDRMAERVGAVSLDLLRDRVERLESEGRPSTVAPPERPARSPAMGWAVAAAAIGSGMLAWGAVGGPAGALLIGSVFLTVGLTLGLVRLRDGSSRGMATPSGARPSMQAEITSMLRNVPVRDDYLAPPGAPLISGFERLHRLAGELSERAHALATATERVASVDSEATELSSSMCLGEAGDGANLAAWLERELPRAERMREAAEVATREKAAIERTRGRLERDASEITREQTQLMDAVRRAAEGATSPVEHVQARVEAHAEADRLRAELERAHPDLAELEGRIRSTGADPEGWALDDSDLARRKARLEEIEAELESLIARGEALERDAAHLRDLETVDAVDSEIASLQESEARLVTERDRKWVLAQLVREADRRFREAHQPDLLRRASEYLRHLTGGRYDRLLVDEAAEGDLFQLVGPGVAAPIPLARPISTGTLEQAYLSLRLAIVDHLDEGKERLPLFMDEVFVNWDDERRERGLEVLAAVSATRQVFAFTCHPEIAAALASRGGRVLSLEP